MAVLDPIKVIIENYPENEEEIFTCPLHPEDESYGKRDVPFSRELYIERDDFMENPPKKYFRLSPGNEVRLRYAYYITCKEVIKNADGSVKELICTYDPATKGGQSPDGRKVKGTIHWVSAKHAKPVEARLYDHLFLMDNPAGEDAENFTDLINPDSLKIVAAYAEPYAAALPVGEKVQFERLAYFCVDYDSTAEKPVFNRTVTLKDSWTKESKK